MKISVKKHGEINGTFWVQLRVGNLNVLGRSPQADSFESLKKNFQFVFDPGDKSYERLQELLDDKVRSEIQKKVKRAWMVINQPEIDHVRNNGEIVLK